MMPMRSAVLAMPSIHWAISVGLVVTGPFTSDAEVKPRSAVGSDWRSLGLPRATPASEQTARAVSFLLQWVRNSLRSWATRAIEGQRTAAIWPGFVSLSIMRRAMRDLPVPQGRIRRPRAWAFLFAWACCFSRVTLVSIASACIWLRVWGGVSWGSEVSGVGGSVGWSAASWVRRSVSMLTRVTGLLPAVFSALVLSRVSPMTISQRSAQSWSAEVARKLSNSALVMSAPRPFSSSFLDLHWMAMSLPSLR